jgi:hypothetical protein
MIPPLTMRQSIPRLPRISLRRPGRKSSIWPQGVQTIVTSSNTSPTRRDSPGLRTLIKVEPFRGDVLADHSWTEFERIQCFPVHHQNLAAFLPAGHARSPRTPPLLARRPLATPPWANHVLVHGRVVRHAARLVSCGLDAAHICANVLAIVHAGEMDFFHRSIG